GDEVLASGPQETIRALDRMLPAKAEEREEIRDLERGAIGDVNYALEELRLEERRLELRHLDAPDAAQRTAEIAAEKQRLEDEYHRLSSELFSRREALLAGTVVMEAAGGKRKDIPVGAIVRAIQPNTLGTLDSILLYGSRIR